MNSVVVLVAKSAVAAAPLQEMSRLVAALEADGLRAAFAFSEQGEPNLREVVLALRAEGVGEIRLVPLLLPMEPAYRAWMTRSVQRWRRESPGDWPVVRIGVAPAEAEAPTLALVRDLAARAAEGAPVPESAKTAPEGSVVPEQKYRVLVCAGGPCNVAGAPILWGRLRNRQEREGLKTAGAGMMSAKATCLGPCNLAPVVQVWPEGTYYGGVDEAGIDRIVDEHVGRGRVVEDLAYAPGGGKQTLRKDRS